MPTHNESVPNRSLNGAELKQILISDFIDLCEQEGMLSNHLAYPRVGYTLTLELHLDNVLNPTSRITRSSRPIAHNLPNEPGFGVLDAPPLVPTEICSTCGAVRDEHPNWDCSTYSATPLEPAGTRLDRLITSPNSERIRNGMPIPVEVKDHDGTTRTEQMIYPPDETLGDGDVKTEDVTQETREKWGLDEIVP